jgi:hypothetical protein
MAVLFLTAVTFFSRFEKFKRSVEVIYIESDNMKRLNALLGELKSIIPADYTVNIQAPKSGRCSLRLNGADSAGL